METDLRKVSPSPLLMSALMAEILLKASNVAGTSSRYLMINCCCLASFKSIINTICHQVFVNESQPLYKPLRRAESGTDGGILLWNNQNCLNLGTKYVFSSMDPITYSTTLNEKCLFLKTSVSVEFKNKGLETLNASLHTEFITLFCLFPINCITQSLRRQIYLISLCQFYLSALETVVINSS